MEKLLILGCGGHGRVIADIVEKNNHYSSIFFLDNKIESSNKFKTNFNKNIIGDISIDNLRKFSNEFSHAFVGIGDNKVRIKWLEELQKIGYIIPNIIDPSAQISRYVDLGKGCFINTNVVIQCNTKIDSGCIVNTSSSIDHDTLIKKGAHISPGVNIAGNVKIGENTWIGLGTKIIQNINIGDNVIVGAGSLVLKNIPNNSKAYGVPSKLIKDI